MDEDYLLACARYVERNPVRAHLAPLLERVGDWKAFLGQDLAPAQTEAIHSAERTGRPLGAPAFVRKLEKKFGRSLARRKLGPKPAHAEGQALAHPPS